MALSAEVQKLVTELKLVEHPEGGWYRETYRSPVKLQTEKGERNLATLIYYLLPAGVESRIHKVSWDEIWLWQGGGVLDVRSYIGDKYQSHLLGHGTGAIPQQLMPAGAWFNAVVTEGEYVLAACMVAPGFDFADLTFR
ncbi:MAG: cupin domain-containing protein [Spirochaetota bacterium]